MFYKEDTIAAISTPSGSGGIAVLRISGSDAISIADKIFSGSLKLTELESHRVTFGRIIHNNKIIDEVLVTVFREPKSYTGENVVEISCHGSDFIANKILELLLQFARLAKPGEFTQRAFMNDKLDLTQAEAIGDLLQAKTKIAHLAAMEQLEGSLYQKIKNILTEITKYRSQVELEIDFIEQEITNVDFKKLKNRLMKLKSELGNLVKTGSEGIILKEGLRVSLVGAPNVGKSTIFNKFLKTERAIVTTIPGTTRDYLEEAVSIDGYLVRFFDTAGIRKARDKIEKLGIKRSYDIIKSSHKVLFIVDKNENLSEYRRLQELIPQHRIIKVLNKADLLTETEINTFKQKGFIICSALKENGLQFLKSKLIDEIRISPDEIKAGILTNTRQIAAVKKTIKYIDKAIQSLEDNLSYEFTAFDLEQASNALEEVIGKVTSEDILKQIFANYCIGK